VADIGGWDLNGVTHAGAVADPVEAWLRCGPTGARDTIVAGRAVVRDGAPVSSRVDEMVSAHAVAAAAMQRYED